MLDRRTWLPVLKAFGMNLRRGLRLTALRPVAARFWATSPEQLIIAVVAALVVGIALQRTFYDASATFNWYAFRGQWLELPAFLLAGWLAARLAKPPVKPLMVPIALFVVGLVMNVVATVVWDVTMKFWPQSRYIVWVVIYYGWRLWFLLIAVVLLRSTARLAYRHVTLAVIPVVALSAYGIWFPAGSVWYEPPPQQQAALSANRDSPVSEEMLYLQPRLLRKTLDAVARQRPGVPDLYFVGFAPYARQDVFMKEVETIRGLMDKRFDTRGRSVLLINNYQTLRQYPLATVTNLRATLKRIGRRIDPKEDVVMIYLTSHGGRDHRLSSSFWPLELEELDPSLLKKMLDDAGIRWRVVVISACYAGGFVKPLEGPRTLVMTAADATHTSFGCSTTSDFTYFGKALFDEQLRKTHSFEVAFDDALPVIRKREQKLGDGFSNPQMAMGESIRAKLAAIARRLDRATAR